MFLFTEFETPLQDFLGKITVRQIWLYKFLCTWSHEITFSTHRLQALAAAARCSAANLLHKSRGDYFDPKKYFHVSFIPFFRFWYWSLLAMMLRKYYIIFVYFLRGKMGKTEKNRKENHATKMTKYQKLKDENMGWRKNKEQKFRIFTADTTLYWNS